MCDLFYIHMHIDTSRRLRAREIGRVIEIECAERRVDGDKLHVAVIAQ